MTSFVRETEQHIKKVLAAGKKLNKKAVSPVLQSYIHELYLQCSEEFLTRVKPETLFIAASQHLDFVDSRNPSKEQFKVRVFNPTLENQGWETERTVIELNLSDAPFILDSITNDILNMGYNIYEVIHPVVRMTRNSKGKVEEVFSSSHLDQSAESCVHLQISHISTQKERNTIQKSIERVLTYVCHAVNDWQLMLDKFHEIMEQVHNQQLPMAKADLDEAFDFFRWTMDNNFIFLGYRKYMFERQEEKIKPIPVKDSDLGILRIKEDEAPQVGLSALPAHVLDASNDSLIDITKSTRRSLVHRPVQMDYIGIKIYDEENNVIGEHRVLGLFTSTVYYQSAMNIPIIRKKIASVIERSDFAPMGHNSKALITILETYPRDELLQIDEQTLLETAMGIVEVTERPSTRLFVRHDKYRRFVSCLVYIPRDRFNTAMRRRVQTMLEETYGGDTSDFYIQLNESSLVRIHILIRTNPEAIKDANLENVQRRVSEACNNWYDSLRTRVIQEMGERDGETMYRYYENAFPESYKEKYHFGGTYHDIVKLEEAYKNEHMTIELYQLESDDDFTYQVKLFSPGQLIMLSEVLPLLENMGFSVIDQQTYRANPEHQKTEAWILHFRLRVSRDMKIPANEDGSSSLPAVKEEFQNALYCIWKSEIENDALNKLILRAKMTARNIVVLRTYLKYTVQTSFPYSKDFMASCVARYPEIASSLVELFNAKFLPGASDDDRQKSTHDVFLKVTKQLNKVENVSDDRILRQFLETIQATLRTNAFQKQDGEFKSYISIKLDSHLVPNLPLPRLFREIFVYAPTIEGIHLRGGKVARGGLRWSDRLEDFRTEVLGLVKAQMVKNAVIVPVGSKGGFVVKESLEGLDRENFMQKGITAYQTFLRGLLDITDNIVGQKIIRPKNVVAHDENDPYLVVAADKGTATFSDIANGISEEYGFWMGDAFASGGSQGYDHKKMAITARGAWVSVKRHFAEMGHDTQTQDFTVAGIGDMAGDVFGNGMLLSKHIRLVAAFNHMHIFLDPNPDAATSYKERERMFNLPRSSWEDYDKKLISKGGGIFSRKEKTIKLSAEVRKALHVEAKELSPDALIRAILTAPVDLLWNGGIGTYVKAEYESHSDVGDKANDALRINGKELRAKVVGEGGNLGLTQNARIEYAAHGGRINTDAIDNSAGVDCSDHEVNIKVALRRVTDSGKMTEKARNKLLVDMTDEVADLVLRDNELQTLALTIAQSQGATILDAENQVMRTLESKKLLNRAVEFLPTDDEIETRRNTKRGLTRPELAVIMSYAKIDLFNEVMDSALPDDLYMRETVVEYFPKVMQKKYKDVLEEHQLRREIVATSVANSIVNRMGSAFFTRMKEDTGKKGCDIARAYIVTRDAFGLREIWDDVEEIAPILSVEILSRILLDIRSFVKRSASWFLRHHEDPLKAGELVDKYKKPVQELLSKFDDMMSSGVRQAVEQKADEYMGYGIPKGLAFRIAKLEALSSACDIIGVAQKSSLSLVEVGRVYYRAGALLGLGWLRICTRKQETNSHWDELAMQSILDTLYDQQMRITSAIVNTKCDAKHCDGALEAWQASHEKAVDGYLEFKHELEKHENITTAMLMVALQRVEALLIN